MNAKDYLKMKGHMNQDYNSKEKLIGIMEEYAQEKLFAFLKWRRGEQPSEKTITEVENFLSDDLS